MKRRETKKKRKGGGKGQKAQERRPKKAQKKEEETGDKENRKTGDRGTVCRSIDESEVVNRGRRTCALMMERMAREAEAEGGGKTEEVRGNSKEV